MTRIARIMLLVAAFYLLWMFLGEIAARQNWEDGTIPPIVL